MRLSTPSGPAQDILRVAPIVEVTKSHAPTDVVCQRPRQIGLQFLVAVDGTVVAVSQLDAALQIRRSVARY